jgi:UDPglucose--hexose-1-phosphate uridylyltransferase
MPELRRHYFLEDYCIIAAERHKRPSDFRTARQKAGDEGNCPFCPGNEDMTPPADAVYTEHGIFADGDERIRRWQMRVFPNRFAAMLPDPSVPTGEWTALPGRGYHEVIVDTPKHRENPANFGQDEMERLVQVYRDRYVHYSRISGVKYISIFKNWGRGAGASQSHSHSQIIALPILPPMIKREVEALYSAPLCPFCNVVEREESSSRLIAEDEHWIMIAPFYSQAPYEIWIIPRRHLCNLEQLTHDEHKSLAALLGRAFLSLCILLDDPPYNCMLFQHTLGYHFNIRIQPALSIIAGFERGTGIYINSVPPEQAAAELQAAFRTPKG